MTPDTTGSVWLCERCGDAPIPLANVVEHLSANHGPPLPPLAVQVPEKSTDDRVARAAGSLAALMLAAFAAQWVLSPWLDVGLWRCALALFCVRVATHATASEAV